MRSILLSTLLLAPANILHAQPAIQRFDLSGTVGSYRVGATLWVSGQDNVITGHYFYASQLTDIPLTATTEGPTLVLKGGDASAFHLHFTGNGSNHGAQLNFENSIALDGTWTQGSKSLPVHLGFLGIEAAKPGSRRYTDVTDESDQAFEDLVRRFQKAALSGNRKAVSAAISYPLEVNGKHRIRIASEAALTAHWEQIFTPAFLAQLRQAVPHDMFVRNGMAMLGYSGLVWFNAKGATSINLP